MAGIGGRIVGLVLPSSVAPAGTKSLHVLVGVA